MQKLKELIDITYDLLDEVDLYNHQVYGLNYDNSFREFEFSRGKRNYDKIINRLQSVDLPDPDLLLTKTMELEEFKEYLEIILRKILGDKYNDDIKIAKTFVKPKPYSLKCDVATGYKDVAGISTPYKFSVSDQLNQIQLANVANSQIKILLKPLYGRFNKTITNIHYQNFPGILATYIAIYELSKILKQEKLIADYEDYCIYCNSSYAKDDGYLIDALPQYRQKEVREFSEHSNFSFITSDIYSTSLIDEYLSDETAFLNKYRMMLEGKTSIPDYLDHYGVNLKDKNVTLKYLNKIDQVEKRH